MNARKVIAAEFWAMVAIQTIGAIDLPKPDVENSGRRKLPAPRYYAAACILFSILGLVAEVNNRLARVASGVGGTAVLAALLVGVAGPGSRHPGASLGQRVIHFLNRTSNLFAPTAQQAQGQQGSQGEEPQPPDYEEV